jgi:hypothetical protein
MVIITSMWTGLDGRDLIWVMDREGRGIMIHTLSGPAVCLLMLVLITGGKSILMKTGAVEGFGLVFRVQILL